MNHIVSLILLHAEHVSAPVGQDHVLEAAVRVVNVRVAPAAAQSDLTWLKYF